ncbi:M14 family metallopeptidase [Actinomadura alba]|uniref:Peptidase M14 n=1 Tax=Actinomadura alba TaxID=406431 RepID=A0ABR7M2Q7_9ACTN|nr:M14 family metallopeptidase [Actinomadura alba]MBC6470995.1 peptidase M14 [Actinomadura alba]
MRRPRFGRAKIPFAAVLTAALVPVLGFSGSATATSRNVPTPASVIGWEPCADYKLATYEQVADYYRRLDKASDRMKLVEIGKTEFGRTQLMAIISSERNLETKNLERYKQISARLSNARDLTEGQARTLAADGKTIAWVDFGIHSTEVASSQTAPLFAYRLVSDESQKAKRIRDDVVTLVVPNMNPDGTTAVADWYMQNLGTPYRDTTYPWLYQKYAGHDDNRDWYMYNLAETRNIGNQLYHEWFPQLIHNTHQVAAFPARIFVPPFKDPTNPNIPPEVTRGVNLVGSAMTQQLDFEGKTGAVSRQQYDAWWNGGMRSVPQYHNMIGMLTETAHASATPATYDKSTFPKTFADGTSTSEPSTFYPSPYQGGEWHLRDSCEYINTASMAMLDIASEKRQDWLYGGYLTGQRQIKAGGTETYVVPANQADFPTAVKMINALRWEGIEIEQAKAGFTVGTKTYPAGSFIIRAAQAYRPAVVDLLNPQVYPDRRQYPGGPPERPYDIAGWTLPMQMGVAVDKHSEAFQASTTPVTWAKPPAGAVEGGPKYAFALDPRVNDSTTAVNGLLAAGQSVQRATTAVKTRTGELPAGAYLVSPSAASKLTEPANRLGLKVSAVDAAPAKVATLKAPRIGLYKAVGGNADEGWTRYILERFGFGFGSLPDAEIRKGDLRSKYDVIVLPDASYATMRDGKRAGSYPEELTGGMTAAGVGNLKKFVEDGGTLVTLNDAAELPVKAFDLPVTDVTAGVASDKLFVPGSILRSTVDTTDPLAYGMSEEFSAFASSSPAFTVTGDGVRTVGKYPGSGLLKSGWLLGEDLIAGRANVLDAKVGEGDVAILGFKPQHRAQSHGTYRLLFNALYLGTTG